MAQNNYKKFITRKEAAEILGCCYQHVYRLDKSGTLKRHILRSTTRPRYLLSDVLKLNEE